MRTAHLPAMAPSATTDNSVSASIDAISKPPPGIVLPPKDIRITVEKIAGYINRNGPAFEERIRHIEMSNRKFSFFNPADAYHPFYAWRLSEIRAGRGTEIAAGRAGEAAPAPESEKPKGPPEPPEFHFSARMPNINAQDLDVVRLTALFVAKNGRSFMTALSQRETGNYQFDFLRPQHSLYQFFSRLVDQYTELLNSTTLDGGRLEKARMAELEHNIKDRFHMLERAKQRAEWVRYQEHQKAAKEEEAEAERLAYAQVDWHDFVVVETVLFNEADDQTDLPPPTSLSDLQSASLEQKAMMSLQPHNMRIEEAMPTHQDYPYEQYPPQPVQMPPPPQTYTPQPAAPSPRSPAYTVPEPMQDDEEEQRIRERTEARERAAQAQAAAKGGPATMKIRNDYVPRAQAKRQNVQMAICPNCKQQIPYDGLDEHIRIELLDTRWKEQRAKAESRYATTNLSTADVANNLKRLASQRTDVFDAQGQPISEEELARRKKAATSYDGQPESKELARLQQQQMATMNIEEQLRQIQSKFKQ